MLAVPVPAPALGSASGVLAAKRIRCAARSRAQLRRDCREAAAVVGTRVDVVLDRPAVPAGREELLVLEPSGADGGLGRSELTRLATCEGVAMVVRGRSVVTGAVLLIDDGTAASLPALCTGLAFAREHRRPVVIAGPADDGGATRRAACELFRRHDLAVDVADVLAPEDGGYERVVRARGVSLLIESVAAPLTTRDVARGLAATAPCTVLLVR